MDGLRGANRHDGEDTNNDQQGDPEQMGAAVREGARVGAVAIGGVELLWAELRGVGDAG